VALALSFVGMAFEMAWIAPGGGTVCADRMLANRDIAAFLQSQPGPVRVDANATELLTNFGDLRGIDELHGFAAGVSSILLEHEFHTARTRQLFGVTHTVGSMPRAPGDEVVFVGASGLKVFRHLASLPRVWIAHDVRHAPSAEDIRALIRDPAVDLRTLVALPDRVAVEQCPDSGESAHVEERRNNSVSLRVDAACRGLVVLGETWSPGWRASVDGAPAELLRPFGVFRGVVVEKGRHEIVLRYGIL
jgi:hypothetical protein